MTPQELLDSTLYLVSQWCGTTLPRIVVALAGIVLCVRCLMALWEHRRGFALPALAFLLGALLVYSAFDTRPVHWLAATSYHTRIRLIMTLLSVAVLGVGPLGLMHLVKARTLGAGTVIATDLLAGRLQKAAAFGVDVSLDASTTDDRQRLEAVLAATDGRGVDIAIDASGVPSTFTEGLAMVRPGGVLVEAGTFVDMGPVAINPNSAICTRNIAVLGIGGEMATAYGPSMRLMAANLDRYPLTGIVTHRFGFGQADAAIAMAQSGESMQVAFDPGLS